MRITNSLFYSSSMQDSQNAIKKLYDINKQMSSKMKIQNSYEDSSIYVDTMRLNYEITTLDQVKETSSKAQTFAKNTDSTLNQFTTALDTFKTKLIQASNASNSTTSLNALANELESIKEHMISLGNTSINGQFLFSGTSLLQKPLESDGTYQGNGGNLTALIGSGVELPYNIDGQSLFLGKDGDYNRAISTNVSMFDQSKLHPDVMIAGDSIDSSTESYLQATNTIRDLVGDTNSVITDDPNPVFYLAGRKSNGETFSTKINISSSSKVSDLLESIATTYGNTSTNKVVDVSMNAHGQIEVKDLKLGNQILEMNIFGAVDRNATAGTAGNANQNNINTLLANNNVDIIAFNKSNFTTTSSASTITSRADIFNTDTFKIGYPMQDSIGANVKTTTLLSSFMPLNVDHILIGVTPFNTAGKSVQNLMSAIETEYSLPSNSLRLENGQLLADDPTNTLNVTMVSQDVTNTAVNGFSIPDAMNYTQRGFTKDGNSLKSNISQILKNTNEYATASTKLVDVAGVSSLDTKIFVLDYKDKLGVSRSASINLLTAGSTVSIDLNGDGDSSDVSETFSIYNASGVATPADEMTYQQLTDIISMATSASLPTDGVDAGTTVDFLEYNNALITAKSNVEVGLDYKGKITILDKTASKSNIEFSLFDKDTSLFNGTNSASLSFMANDSVTISNPSIDFFKDLDNMIEAVRTGNFRMDGLSADPRNIGIQNSISQLDHILDHTTKEQTKIGAYSNALTNASDRAEYLSLHVKTVRSSVIDVDIAEAYLQFNEISNSYQAMLSTIAKINSMSLLKYM